MKLKGLNNRAYNILFHTHTVSGIVISFALYVIFMAGAFSLFRNEIHQWEDTKLRQPLVENFSLDNSLLKIDSAYGLDFYEFTNIYPPSKLSPVVKVYGAKSINDSTSERMGASLNLADGTIQDLYKPKTTVGDTLYELHFFRQIPLGSYLAGLIGFFFVFASLTGLLIHWKNLFTKFFAFVTEGKWKNIWTNTHTVFGLIGLPFQLMYAVTGAFFCTSILVLVPIVLLLYNGDVDKVYAKIQPERAIVLDKNANPAHHLSLDNIYQKTIAQFPEHQVLNFQVRNYGKSDALASLNIDDHKSIGGSGNLIMYLKDGQIIDDYSKIPFQKSYKNAVLAYMYKFHFATFGGLVLKVIYFLLAMLTCLIIISGVLIWRTARDNKRYTFKQKLFHHRVTKIYLAICFSLFPAIALLFIANKLIPMHLGSRVFIVNSIFFISWLVLTIRGSFWNQYARQNRNFLLLGGWLSLAIPLLNGWTTGDWFWSTLQTYPAVAFIDLLWLVIGLTTIVIASKMIHLEKGSNAPILED